MYLEVISMSQPSILPVIHLTHNVIVKSPGLPPMLYKVRELAEELEMPERTLRDWLICGAPHTRDRFGHIWINGQEFAAWVKSHRMEKNAMRMQKGEAYCFRCKQKVNPSNLVPHRVVGRLVLMTGKCPKCGSQVQRGARDD